VSTEESALRADPRFQEAVRLFNDGDWYACHDGFEELWHETQGPMRPVLQGFLQIAVAELHQERGNRRGATVLMGEGLGRLRSCGEEALGIRLASLRRCSGERLAALQADRSLEDLPRPRLELGETRGQ
jgi:predicted metal-dependent hydrolase